MRQYNPFISVIFNLVCTLYIEIYGVEFNYLHSLVALKHALKLILSP